ncbi:cell division protein FtsI [uncultured Aquabacterium sp.]|uniref:cell division protein FtsI n=1 Tax=uncultured Aquabacterium sp. TaxID=158753 RepID=UPI00262A422B|nr:cell division protein FtsI [uncultured Aquabacterium sp.]
MPITVPRFSFVTPKRAARHGIRAAGCGALLALSGCSLLSISPTVEVVKAAGLAASNVLHTAPTSARDVVWHPHPAYDNLCIELNRVAHPHDVVPSIQAELAALGVQSRVYEASGVPFTCRVVLSYTAFIQWEVPTFGTDAEPYLAMASLTVREQGRVLANASFALDAMGFGKWAATRSKLAPLVRAVVRGPDGGAVAKVAGG